ncbi:MAG: DinB family protein [Chloroflexi bacterium]|nr:DinB family protein [Chloroflexota bacterium]
MEAKELLRDQFKTMHQFMDMTIADCSPEVLEKKEDGWTINKLGSVYAHTVLSEDMMLSGMVDGREPVLKSDGWAEKLGVDAASARQDETLAGLTVDLVAFREYAKAVAAATDDFLANATDQELNKEVDSPVGKQPFITYFANLGLTHIAGHWGEIAALKGVQGLKGLPF